MQDIHVALPDSLLMEDRDLRDKTVKLGFVARALAIYRVKKVFIFRDPVESLHRRVANFILELLSYAETPQYLRKKLYSIKPELKFAGILPPLKIPSHKKERILIEKEFREGIVELKDGKKTVYVGVEKNLPFIGNSKIGRRVTVRIEKSEHGYFAVEVSREEVPDYWGYTVSLEDNILQLCRSYKFSVVTSRFGERIEENWDRLRKLLASNSGSSSPILIIFGAPKRGLLEMYTEKQWLEVSKLIINTIPKQGVETVRTEEALLATLEAFTLAMNLKD